MIDETAIRDTPHEESFENSDKHSRHLIIPLDVGGIFSYEMLIVIAVFLFLDVFDTLGPLVRIAPEAGLIKNGRPDISHRALIADAGGTIVGALLGTSTITCYVESAAGMQSGARFFSVRISGSTCPRS